MQRRPHQPYHHQKQQRQKTATTTRLKCLVLGAESAGKTSLLRRYFHHTFEESRLPTIGSDFYTGRCPDPRRHHPAGGDEAGAASAAGGGGQSPIYVNLQMWDTPGRERFALKRPPRKYAATLTPAFFRQADAILLVYDMCSSTSFTQLLKWYADLMEFQKSNHQVLPMIIVAGKLDLYRRKNVDVTDHVLLNNNNNNTQEQQQQQHSHPAHSRRRRVSQRDVMGLRGDFKGKDFRYEYQVSTTTTTTTNNNTTTPLNGSSMTGTNSQGGGLEHDSTASNNNNSNRKKNRRMEISSYLANRENWTTDWSYLDSLLNSEDLSHPDREMVLLWCMRNNLKHFETSAATGEGVTEAMEALLELALVAKEQKEAAPQPPPPVPSLVTSSSSASVSVSVSTSSVSHETRGTRQRLEKLDLHQRYASKEDNRCFLCMRPVLQLFQKFVM